MNREIENQSEEMPGDSIENAIKINSENPKIGIAVEYKLLEKMYGMRGKNWMLITQDSFGREDKRYDVLEILLLEGNENGQKKEIYFDITAFFNNWGKENK